MASAYWRTGFTVADLVKRNDAGWSFFQLVKLLLANHQLAPDDLAGEKLLEVLNSYFYFRAAHQTDFPAGEIRAIKGARGRHKNKYEISSIGNHLSGVNGPLPDGLSDMLQDDLRHSDGILAAFLDLFNHRLQCLRVMLEVQHNNNLCMTDVQHSNFGQLALALSGNLTDAHRNLYHQSASTLINMSGALANRRMALPTIQGLFKAVLGVPLKSMRYLIGRWLSVAEEDHIKLGQKNNRLGQQATLGTKIWDQQAAVGVVIGPLPEKKVREMLPQGEAYQSLFALLQWITDCQCDCQVTLLCDASVTDSARLSSSADDASHLNMLSRLGQSGAPLPVTYMVDLVNIKKEVTQ